jgi:hypothetical protein
MVELDFSDLEKKFAVQKPDVHEGYVVVDCLPIVPAAKVARLEGVIRKIFGEDGCEVSMCLEEDGSTKGNFACEISKGPLLKKSLKLTL